MKRHYAVVAVSLVAVFALLFAVNAQAAAPTQRQHLVATPKVQTWVSKNVPGTVAVFVTDVHGEVEQQWVNGCRARYIDPAIGLFVSVHIRDCHSGGGPYVVRYFSHSGKKPFTFFQYKEG